MHISRRTRRYRLGFQALERRDLLAGLSFDNDKDGGATRIVGGGPATEGDWPWMASIQSVFQSHFCGGSLIAPDAILTAAHCVEGSRPDQISVVLGRYDLTTNVGKRHDVAQIIVHPRYNSFSNDSDVAILLLETPSDRTTIPILSANNTELAEPGVTSTVIGWGNLREGGSSPDELHEVDIPIVSNAVANQPQSYNGGITPRMLAAGLAEGGKDSCQGDSGGPLMVTDEDGSYHQAGIVSFGDGCAAPNDYGIYARVSAFTEWIERQAVLSSAGSVGFVQERFEIDDTLGIQLRDIDLHNVEEASVTVTSDTGDAETLVLSAVLAGRFEGSLPLGAGAPMPGDGRLQAAERGTISVAYADADDGTGASATVVDTATILGDDHTNGVEGATALAESAFGEIERDGDVDWFRFPVSTGSVYRFDVALESLNDSILALYDVTGASEILSDDDGGDGFSSRIVWESDSDGVIHVEVRGFGSNVGTYELIVDALDPAADDHGASASTASPAIPANPVAGMIDSIGDRDWLAYELESNQRYTFTVQLLTLDDSVLRLIDSDGVTELDENDDGGSGLASELSFVPDVSGTYYIEVSGFDDNIGNYVLHVDSNAVEADDHGNRPQDATPIVVGTSAEGTITIADSDWFEITAVSGFEYEFATELITLGDSTLELLDAEGRRVAFNDDDDVNISFASRIRWTATESGNFFLRVAGFDAGEVGSYRLTTEFAGDIPDDDHGNQFEDATLLPLGEMDEGTIDRPDDEDWFAMEVGAAAYDLTVTMGPNSDLEFRFVTSDGFEVVEPFMDERGRYRIVYRSFFDTQFFLVATGTVGSYDVSARIPYGDSNLDGYFDSADLVQIFQRGEYEDDVPNNSIWEDGDWNGDGDFTTSDLTKAFQVGTYVAVRPAAAVSAIAAARDAVFSEAESLWNTRHFQRTTVENSNTRNRLFDPDEPILR